MRAEVSDICIDCCVNKLRTNKSCRFNLVYTSVGEVHRAMYNITKPTTTAKKHINKKNQKLLNLIFPL
jgi:hypothetical protein